MAAILLMISGCSRVNRSSAPCADLLSGSRRAYISPDQKLIAGSASSDGAGQTDAIRVVAVDNRFEQCSLLREIHVGGLLDSFAWMGKNILVAVRPDAEAASTVAIYTSDGTLEDSLETELDLSGGIAANMAGDTIVGAGQMPSPLALNNDLYRIDLIRRAVSAIDSTPSLTEESPTFLSENRLVYVAAPFPTPPEGEGPRLQALDLESRKRVDLTPTDLSVTSLARTVTRSGLFFSGYLISDASAASRLWRLDPAAPGTPDQLPLGESGGVLDVTAAGTFALINSGLGVRIVGLRL